MTRPVNSAGQALIKEFEGCELVAYLCPANIWTIGWGHTSAAGAPSVHAGLRITQALADEIFVRDLEPYARCVEQHVKVKLTDNQFAALVSFTYNVGQGAFRSSTLLKKLNAGDYDAVPAELKKWNKGGGKVLPGLVRRRAAEAALWLSDAPSKAPAVQVSPVKPAVSAGRIIAAGATASTTAATAAVADGGSVAGVVAFLVILAVAVAVGVFLYRRKS